MIEILLKTDSRYPVDRKRIRKTAEEILNEENITTDCQISIYVCGDRKMRTLNKKYRDIKETTDVLSFGATDGQQCFLYSLPKSASHTSEVSPVVFLQFTAGKSDVLYLGDIAISYPEARKNAMNNELLVDEEIDNLVKHGILHLLGKHHD